MVDPRLKSSIFVSAALRRAGGTGNPGAVLRRGDPDAGGIIVILRNREGLVTVLSQARTGEGEAAWLRATGPTPVPESDGQAYIDRQLKRDPDLWIVEFDSQDMIPPFDAHYV